MKYLYYRVHFVDVGGKVLADQALLKSVGYQTKVPRQFPFKANLKIPQDATAMAFSYRGWAIGGSRAEDWEFWKAP